MKRMSLKIRISLWFTILLVVICIAVFFVAIEVYWNYEEKLIQNDLLDEVEKEVYLLQTNTDYLDRFYQGELPASEFLKNDIYIAVYNEENEIISGISVDEALSTQAYSDSFMPQSLMINSHQYYFYDSWVTIQGSTDLYVRGVVKAEKSIWEILNDHWYLLFIIPLLMILAFLGGYWLTGRFLKPIRKIDETAELIRKSGDLSNRIETSGPKDEITTLALHINAMFEQLENNFESQKQFASNVSHELRTPVAVMLAQCEYAIDNANDKLDLYQTLSAIQKQGYKMSNLIESLLLFNRINQGTGNYQKEKTDIEQLVLSACEDFQLIAEKNINVVTKTPGPIEAWINIDLFNLMLNNLIQNAIRYGKENGMVFVTLENCSLTFTLSVTDNGTGIPEEDLPHIFDLFYQGDKSRSSGGLGLGLPLVKQIVQYHNGTISVESTVDEGTIFLIELPKTDL